MDIDGGQVPLDYARRSLRPRHSFFSVLAVIMAGVSVLWLGYVQAKLGNHIGASLLDNPVASALLDTYEWPCGIGIGLAVLGILQTGRKRTLSFLAIGIIVAAYVLLMPSLNFS